MHHRAGGKSELTVGSEFHDEVDMTVGFNDLIEFNYNREQGDH